MCNLIEIPLGSEGAEYLRSCLSQGEGLCASVLKLVADKGTTIALVPAGTSEARTKEMRTGGLMSRGDMKTWLASHVFRKLSSNPQTSFIVQDIWAKPSDKYVLSRKEQKFFSAPTGVYYVFNGADVPASIAESVDVVESYLFVAVLTQWTPDIDKLAPDQMVDNAVIENIAANAREIFVSAYDQEGLIIWRKTAPPCGRDG
jgi:hypothetical protein